MEKAGEVYMKNQRKQRKKRRKKTHTHGFSLSFRYIVRGTTQSERIHMSEYNLEDTPSAYLSHDHRYIDRLFERALQHDTVDMLLYTKFRIRLLRHIAIEEQLVLPVIRKHLPGGFPMETQLRLEHGALAALLVPPPDTDVTDVLACLLRKHNALEEAHGTLYELLDNCARLEDDDVTAAIRNHPEPPLSRFINNPMALEPAKRALDRAGYSFDALLREARTS